ncbi:gallate dioxygenase [Oceanobacter antarcticus]|uniref:Gallate dioxygenase n=1 Tax=Oceanobacter antarcticus TaxID=3133425 RepID=A0ABW8NKB4_9GAMM
MATIVGGLGLSHSPTIISGKLNNKAADPAWKPIFDNFEVVRDWLKQKDIDAIFMIYNDHITSFFFDHYSAFVMGVDDEYKPADEGGGVTPIPPIPGHAALARHIGQVLVAEEFDMSFFQNKGIDHGCFSPLSMIALDEDGWKGSIVPLQVGVLQWPVPSAARCYKLGKALRQAIQSYPEELRVAVVATGGLSHQVHGERCGFTNQAWDEEFLDLLESDPEQLTELTIGEYAKRGGWEGAEVIMWLIMRGALSDQVKRVHRATYLPSMTNIATLVLEDLGEDMPEPQQQAVRAKMTHQLSGSEELEGTYPFSYETSRKAWRMNEFLHELIVPQHRQAFLEDPETLYEQYGLTEEERDMLRHNQWIEMIHYGVIFFLIEKTAAVRGVSNPELYANFRGMSLEDFQQTRNVAIKYSVSHTADSE